MKNPTSLLHPMVLITGASGGIGYEFCKLFAKDGYGLVLVARDEKKLESVKAELVADFNSTVKVIVKDLSIANSSQEIFMELEKENICIDILVNNAGFATYGFFSETDLESELQMLQTNVVSLTHLTKLFLKPMLKRKSGKILNVASVAAFQPGPLMAVYYASKSYVLSFSEAIANELEGTGVTVTALCPGPTSSGFQTRAHMEKVELFNKSIMDPKTVAEIGYKGLMKGKTVVVTGFKNKFFSKLINFIPRNLVTALVRKIQHP